MTAPAFVTDTGVRYLGIPVTVTPLCPRSTVFLVRGKVYCDIVGYWHIAELDDRRAGAPRWDEGWEG